MNQHFVYFRSIEVTHRFHRSCGLRTGPRSGAEPPARQSRISTGAGKGRDRGKQPWTDAPRELRERELLDTDGELTEDGVGLRKEIGVKADRIDRAPSGHLGAEKVERLTELVTGLTLAATEAGAFPAGLIGTAESPPGEHDGNA